MQNDELDDPIFGNDLEGLDDDLLFDADDDGFVIGDADLNEFEEYAEIDSENINLRTAILQKNDMIGLLGMMSASSSATICRVDPREAMPAVQIYDDVAAAEEWFSKSLGSSRRNGWNVLYDGLPLRG